MCHAINETAQLTQGYRYLQYHKWGGKEKEALENAADTAKGAVKEVEGKVLEVVGKK